MIILCPRKKTSRGLKTNIKNKLIIIVIIYWYSKYTRKKEKTTYNFKNTNLILKQFYVVIYRSWF